VRDWFRRLESERPQHVRSIRSGVLSPEQVVGAETGSCPPPLCATTRARPHTPGDAILRASLEPADGRHLPRLEENHAAPPPSRPPRDDVGLPHSRPRALRRGIRDRSEIAELHGADGKLEAVTIRSGERLAFSFLFAVGLAPNGLQPRDRRRTPYRNGRRRGGPRGARTRRRTYDPQTHASIAERDDIEVRLNQRVATRRQLRDSVTHGQVSGSSSSPAP
jgi:hypothetical protein